MRSRAPVLALVPLLAACVAAPAAASAASSTAGANIAPYTVKVDNASDVAQLQKIGIDMTETGYNPSDPQEQTLGVYLEPSQASELETLGLDPVAAPLSAPSLKSKAL